MKAYWKAVATFAILVILIAGLYLFANWFSITTGYVLGEDEKVKLAQCLGSEAILYISSSCFACSQQLELFDEAKRFLEIKTCGNLNSCPKLKGVPAWKIKEEHYYGVKTLSELIELSKCAV